MWLLSTDRAELRFFSSPESVDGGYAILSHVWDQEEQLFKEVQKINKRCKASGANPRDLVCDKIRNACALAEEHGFRWIWIDTCCIDKSSSAELSEAINSMFRYYSQASICYAYLRDVNASGTSPSRVLPPFDFSRSMWHRRGWTLQELIAPPLLLFVSASWAVLGSKADYAMTLENITGIPAAVLRLERTVSEIPIAHRMSWAADRKTSREEDIAYCLLGIFNITMPTLYGEGRRAFQRLQEEIMKVDPDSTLFAKSWTEPSRDRHQQNCTFIGDICNSLLCSR